MCTWPGSQVNIVGLCKEYDTVVVTRSITLDDSRDTWTQLPMWLPRVSSPPPAEQEKATAIALGFHPADTATPNPQQAP